MTPDVPQVDALFIGGPKDGWTVRVPMVQNLWNEMTGPVGWHPPEAIPFEWLDDVSDRSTARMVGHYSLQNGHASPFRDVKPTYRWVPS